MKRPCAVDPHNSDLSDLHATLLNNDATARRIHDRNATAVTIERAQNIREITGTRAGTSASSDARAASTIAKVRASNVAHFGDARSPHCHSRAGVKRANLESRDSGFAAIGPRFARTRWHRPGLTDVRSPSICDRRTRPSSTTASRRGSARSGFRRKCAPCSGSASR
jgi:hypothetical protein